jgi:ERCC4-type nuclease
MQTNNSHDVIAIDRREGSGYLAQLLPPGLTTVTTLPYGDAAWYGVGPGGGRVGVGVECKKVGDLLNCLHTGRFVGHQLPGMVLAYGYVYLLIEGVVRPGPEGELQSLRWWSNRRGGDWVNAWGQKPITYAAWEAHLETLRRKTPLRVVHTIDEHHTAKMILTLYKWWAHSGGWDSHTSHGGVHVLPDAYVPAITLPVHRRTVIRVAQQLPGVRDVLAQRVADRFATVADMVAAGVEEWQQVEGLGGVKINAILTALRGPHVTISQQRAGGVGAGVNTNNNNANAATLPGKPKTTTRKRKAIVQP